MDYTREYLERLVSDQIEESGQLEYKRASLSRVDDKKKEMTKDISAFANASGGLLIYGIQEFSDKDRSHLPEKLTP